MAEDTDAGCVCVAPVKVVDEKLDAQKSAGENDEPEPREWFFRWEFETSDAFWDGILTEEDRREMYDLALAGSEESFERMALLTRDDCSKV